MSFWNDLLGKTAAEEAQKAAADQYAKQQAAIAKLIGYGDEYASDMGNLYQPYAATGLSANTGIARLMADPSSVRGLPSYQFAMDEGINALDRSAASRGMLHSGRQSKDLMRFATGLADQTYGNQLSRLMGVTTGVGLPGTAGQAAGLQGQLGARTTAYGGDMGSAGTIGQGMIAGANARSAGIQNLMNTGVRLAGMAMGVPSFSFGFGGGGMGAER